MLAETSKPVKQAPDRRRKPRISVPFRAKVEGIDDQGEAFSTETVLDNISARGLYVRLMPCVELGRKISIVVEQPLPPNVPNETARFSIDGIVTRVEKKSGGACGVAVTFDHVSVF